MTNEQYEWVWHYPDWLSSQKNDEQNNKSPFLKEPDFYKFGMIWHHFNEFSQFSSLKLASSSIFCKRLQEMSEKWVLKQ
jgi:hypothetical protein